MIDNALNNALRVQEIELFESLIYKKIARSTKNKDNKRILEEIANDEFSHYLFWKNITKKKVRVNKIKLFFYYILIKFFGLNFGIKLMEREEERAQINYADFKNYFEGIEFIITQENEHEKKLIGMLNEKKLEYISSIVLGMNDAIVELTGTLAGLTFSIRDSKIVALAGIITGIAASLSMAASEYLSQKSEGAKTPFVASFYTGITYVFTVFIMILPYILFHNVYIAFILSLISVIFIIFIFNYYISVAQDKNFKKSFFEMLFIGLSVAAISFGIGLVAKTFLGISD